MIVEFSLCLLTISHFGMFLAGSLRKIQVLSDFTLQMAFQVHTAALPLQLKFQPILLLTVHINYCHLRSADISTAFIIF